MTITSFTQGKKILEQMPFSTWHSPHFSWTCCTAPLKQIQSRLKSGNKTCKWILWPISSHYQSDLPRHRHPQTSPQNNQRMEILPADIFQSDIPTATDKSCLQQTCPFVVSMWHRSLCIEIAKHCLHFIFPYTVSIDFSDFLGTAETREKLSDLKKLMRAFYCAEGLKSPQPCPK